MTRGAVVRLYRWSYSVVHDVEGLISKSTRPLEEIAKAKHWTLTFCGPATNCTHLRYALSSSPDQVKVMTSAGPASTDNEESGEQANLYRVLGYDEALAGQALSGSDIRAAYKKALLAHHPDKQTTKEVSDKVTIDTISLAYRVLSDRTLRNEYDQSLLTTRSDHVRNKFTIFRTGLETVDLDDLRYDELRRVWTKICRCGAGGGYTVTEGELERHIEDGELVTGCTGCSLWIRVLFSAE